MTACTSERWEGHGSRGAGRQGCRLLPRGLSPFGFLRSRFARGSLPLPEAMSLLDVPQSQSKRETGQRWGCEGDSASQASLTPPEMEVGMSPAGTGSLLAGEHVAEAPSPEATNLSPCCFFVRLY